MDERAIADRLIKKGEDQFNSPKNPVVQLSGSPDADALLNNLDEYPHAFVIGCLMDKQVPYQVAWMIPYHFSNAVGDFSIKTLAQLSIGDIEKHMKHRFPKVMSEVFHDAIQHIVEKYDGDASRIWKGEPQSSAVVYQFRQFKGAGPKIASMATSLLARGFKIKFSDYSDVDISADVHVCRVFRRLGLSLSEDTELVIEKARKLHPKFPGIMDRPCWNIGRDWCHPTDPECGSCYMKDLCPSRKEI